MLKSELFVSDSYSNIHFQIDLFLLTVGEIISLNIIQDIGTSKFYGTIIYKEKPKRRKGGKTDVNE